MTKRKQTKWEEAWEIIKEPTMWTKMQMEALGHKEYVETRVFTPCPNCGRDISSCRVGHQCPQY